MHIDTLHVDIPDVFGLGFALVDSLRIEFLPSGKANNYCSLEWCSFIHSVCAIEHECVFSFHASLLMFF